MRQVLLPAATAMLAVAAPAFAAQPVAAAPGPEREPTDVFIRRQAGLPAASAQGDIRIVDVGHSPMSTMLSLVARHTPEGWRVSYACAESPHCGTGGQDHLALSYLLDPATGAKVDAALARLRAEPDVGGTPPRPELICGHLNVAIDYAGLRRDYTRACAWGPELGELEQLLLPKHSQAAGP